LICAEGNQYEKDMGTFHELSAKLIDGEEMKFDTLRGKVVLVVNVASFW